MSMMLASTPLPPLQPTRQALRACPIAPLQGARYAAVLRWVAMEAVDGGGETARGEGARGGQRRASVQRGLCAFEKKVESMSVHMPAHACAHTRTSVRMSVPSPLCMPVCVLARMPVHMTARMSVHVAVRMAARVSGAHVGTSVYCFAGRPIRTHVYAQVSLHLHMAINI